MLLGLQAVDDAGAGAGAASAGRSTAGLGARRAKRNQNHSTPSTSRGGSVETEIETGVAVWGPFSLSFGYVSSVSVKDTCTVSNSALPHESVS